ncbi:hypothetical protein ACRB8A_19710 (plasmid) [Arthrobacter sp. G.S.26]|uniref:hypothetical protein n=1 Tax=Arthrobacter sp. G.S.26 TaxID=3433706 RepID=UPI003D772BD3
MTAVQTEAPLAAAVDVRFTLDGTPLAVRYDGHIWAVAADPVRWFERESWWETQNRAPVGAAVVDTTIWQVQVRINSASPLRTMQLRQPAMTDHWILTSIDDAT